ncbi:DUF2752 domain-containing protein [Dysgonomonas sp. Marseille-P4677]|uniref:DUF2752 domain-containing protein n=1 Tax=Dysgonomonas sp. Marseille-P4677 TaxID=2364790 RepID=UPI001912726C|nr:DUF2752 domain-containing protein [Dysgonomonas sp. Marseille-P4677]MBK5720471.1 DUF2752 domain-containing protein [Dysgonomonas sp. Marseille-P4677]
MLNKGDKQPRKKSKHIQQLLAIVFLLLTGGLFYYLFSPEESDLFPKCVFHSMTGLDCPGCGSQRAIHHLLHLRIKEAFLSNALLILVIPYIILCIYIEYFGGKEKFPKIRKIVFSKTAIWGILIIILLFWIGRNLI